MKASKQGEGKKAAPGGHTQKAAPKKAPKTAAPAPTLPDNPMQRNHLQEETEVLLVYGWPTRVVFPGGDIRAKLDALAAALAGTEDVFVVAQDLVYCDGRMETVFGRAAIRVHANAGPVEVPIDVVRAIEAAAPPLSSEARGKLLPLVDGAIPEGSPTWYLVPTGSLATGYMAFGEIQGRDRDTKAPAGAELVYGGDTRQESHKKAVVGEWVGNASDWNVLPIDLSPATDGARRARRPGGRYYVMGRYD